MDEQLKSNLTSGRHWMRLIYMILFAVFLQVASVVMTVLVVVQFLFALITGADNINLRKFGDSLSIYIFSVLQFLIYNSEEKPFPFADWPESSVKTEIAPAAGPVETVELTPVKPKTRTRKQTEKKEELAEENVTEENVKDSEDDQKDQHPVV